MTTSTSIHSANDDISLDGSRNGASRRRRSSKPRQSQGRAQNYKLRDWLFSRQRYWGEPFPVLHGPNGEIRTVDEADLPVDLPEMEDFKPTGSDDPDAPPQPPLGRADDDWINRRRSTAFEYTRELNTMPNWAGSCWYYLRYLDNKNDDALVGEDAEKVLDGQREGIRGRRHHAGGVDLYVGGVEHAVLHLLYARFWHKFLFDLGVVSTPEPFGRYFARAISRPTATATSAVSRSKPIEVKNQDGKPACGGAGTRRARRSPTTANRSPKSSARWANRSRTPSPPTTICEQYGCDTLRLYEMYIGPLDQSKIWNTNDIVGVHRFLNRLWRNFVDEDTGESLVDNHDAPEDLSRLTHKTIKRVTDAMESMSFNVAIAALIELNNALVPLKSVPRFTAAAMLQMLAPMAPHVAEELWERLHHGADGCSWETSGGVADAGWPLYSEAMLVEDQVEYPVQVNGKMRGKVQVAADADEDAIVAAAKGESNVAVHLEGKSIRKVIVVPGRMVNLIAN